MAKKRVNVYELKDLRNPILRKKAEKKFKKMKNPKDYDNPDYYDRKMGGKVQKKAALQMDRIEAGVERQRQLKEHAGGKALNTMTNKEKRNLIKKISPKLKSIVATRKLTKRPMGGKVYKVDNSGQDLVQRMYGGKIKK